jgi:hypothetical protein
MEQQAKRQMSTGRFATPTTALKSYVVPTTFAPLHDVPCNHRSRGLPIRRGCGIPRPPVEQSSLCPPMRMQHEHTMVRPLAPEDALQHAGRRRGLGWMPGPEVPLHGRSCAHVRERRARVVSRTRWPPASGIRPGPFLCTGVSFHLVLLVRPHHANCACGCKSLARAPRRGEISPPARAVSGPAAELGASTLPA